MKRRLLIIIGTLAMLCLLAVGLSHLVYGRSLQASVYEILLRRRFATDQTPEGEIERLKRKKEKGESKYELPEDLSFRSGIEEADFNGMQVFMLNGDAAGDADVLYLHGGAYINPFNVYQWKFMDRLASAADCRVIAPAYHLAPFADYRQAYEDLIGLYREMIKDERRIVLMGDSAGGGLALGFAEALLISGDVLPSQLILFSPWVDASMENSDIAEYIQVDPILHLDIVKIHGRVWSGGDDTKYWPVSPLYGDMEGLPPVTIYCGTREILYPDILRLMERFDAAGVSARLVAGRGLNHDYPLMPLPEADKAVREVIELVTVQPN